MSVWAGRAMHASGDVASCQYMPAPVVRCRGTPAGFSVVLLRAVCEVEAACHQRGIRRACVDNHHLVVRSDVAAVN